MESSEICFVFLSTPRQRELPSIILLSGAFTSQPHAQFTLMIQFAFFFSFLRILADSASVEFVLFLASLQFHKEIFETERLYVSSGVSWKKRKKKKNGRVTLPKIIVAASNMCL